MLEDAFAVLLLRFSLIDAVSAIRLTNRSHQMPAVSRSRFVVVPLYGRLVLNLGMSHPFTLNLDLCGTCLNPSTVTEGGGRLDMDIQPSSTDRTLVSNALQES